RLQHPEAAAGAATAKPPGAQQPVPNALPIATGTKFGHFRFQLPKAWAQSEEDGSLMLRPAGGAEKGVGILLFGAESHKGDQPLDSFEKWFAETCAWLDEGRTVLQATEPKDKEGRYPMRLQIAVVKKPDGTSQARVYVGLKRERHAELIVMFAPDAA